MLWSGMKTEREKKLPSLLILVFVGSAWGDWAPYTMQYISPWDHPHPEQTATPHNFNFPAEIKRIRFRTRCKFLRNPTWLYIWDTAPASAPQDKTLQCHLPHVLISVTQDSDRVTGNFSYSTLQSFVSYLLPWDTEMAELLRTNDQKRENTKGIEKQSGKKATVDFPSLC